MQPSRFAHSQSRFFQIQFLRKKKSDGLQLDKPKQQKHGSIFSLWSVSWFGSRWLGSFGIPKTWKEVVFLETKPRIESQTIGPQINPWLRSSQTNHPFQQPPWCWDTTSRCPSWFDCWNPAFLYSTLRILGMSWGVKLTPFLRPFSGCHVWRVWCFHRRGQDP